MREVRVFADEVLVGVDADSTDDTLQIAKSFADVVYEFRIQGQLAPARMLPLKYASGDWILSIDDDETIEDTFDAIASELMQNAHVTHYYFPRKWIVNEDPFEFLYAPPWFPNWTLRLFRNDPRLVWKPARPHSGYNVQGLGFYEPRASILHFEPIIRSPEERHDKVLTYRKAGSGGIAEDFYRSPAAGTHRKNAVRRSKRFVGSALDAARLVPGTHELSTAAHPPWGCQIIDVQTMERVSPNEHFLAEVNVRNTGVLSWCTRNENWPILQLGAHLLDSNGILIIQDFARTPLQKNVEPGGEATFLCLLLAPPYPGRYVVEWDMVSENECWFADCGGHTLQINLHVSDNRFAV